MVDHNLAVANFILLSPMDSQVNHPLLKFILLQPRTIPNILNSIPPEQWKVLRDGGAFGPAPHTLLKQSVKNCIIKGDFKDDCAGVQFTKGMQGRILEQYDVVGGRPWAKVLLEGMEERELWVLRRDVDVVPDKSPKA
jgi:hypothetical protein